MTETAQPRRVESVWDYPRPPRVEPSERHIRIVVDGIDVKDLRLDSLRRHVGMVLQETFLFSATLAENIGYGRPDASSDEIEAAAKAAALWDFIETLPDGLDTAVGERGVTLSGGQKQRVSIARASFWPRRVPPSPSRTSICSSPPTPTTLRRSTPAAGPGCCWGSSRRR